MKSTRARTRARVALTGVILALVVLASGFACDTNGVHRAAVAVNKYAESLSHFQDAEIVYYQDGGKIDDATHRSILGAEKLAAEAGKNLDKAITAAANGGDANQYIDLANSSFADMVTAIVVKDVNTRSELIALSNISSSLLKNAISLIQAIKPPKPAPPTPAPPARSLYLSLSLAFMFGMATGAGTLTQILALLNAVALLEPVAFDLVLKLAQDLQGKTVDEVVAMNEAIFGKVTTVADAEIAKLDEKEGAGK